MVLRVLTEPDDALHARCAEVGDIDSDVMRLACDMADTMYADGGVGLAAPQVGCLLRLVVIDTGYPLTGRREPSVLVNPEIVVADGGTFRMDESCLSFPGADAVVARPAHVVVTYTGIDGRNRLIEATSSLLSACLQHELDHLDGVTLPDRLAPRDRLRFLMELGSR